MGKDDKNTNKQTAFLQKNSMQLFLLLLSSLITIANLFIASLLSPIKSDIQRVEAITLQNQQILEKKEVLIDKIEVIIKQLDTLEKRIDRIENKLDR